MRCFNLGAWRDRFSPVTRLSCSRLSIKSLPAEDDDPLTKSATTSGAIATTVGIKLELEEGPLPGGVLE